MDPKAKEYCYLGPARNRPSESKHVLVRTVKKVIITRNFTWALIPLSRPPTARYTPSVEVEACDRGSDQKASSFRGVTESGGGKYVSIGEGDEMVMTKADDTERENNTLVSERAVPTSSRAGSRVHKGVYLSKRPRAFRRGSC